MSLSLLFSDMSGRLYVEHSLLAAGRAGVDLWQLEDEDVIPMPEGADLVLLPGRLPVGIDPVSGEIETLEGSGNIDGQPLAVAATLPVGYTRTYLPAFEKTEGADILPLFGYAAVVMKDDQLFVCAVQTDELVKWNPSSYDEEKVASAVGIRLAEKPTNRILKQLGRCSLDYHCRTAQNIFLHRWEGGIPVSSWCNAACVGCISLQEAECCPAPQSRIEFTPSVDEIVEVAVPHLETAEDAIVSFGQGCEGEPLTQGDLIATAIREIRHRTSRGTININSNAGLTLAVAKVVEAGLDSIRVSLFSPFSDEYAAYHRPKGYCLDDVRESIRICRKAGVAVSLNLLTFPGYTDAKHRAQALVQFVRELDISLIQFRNLNIDPDALYELTGIQPDEECLGINGLIQLIADKCPEVEIGNYSRPC